MKTGSRLAARTPDIILHCGLALLLVLGTYSCDSLPELEFPEVSTERADPDGSKYSVELQGNLDFRLGLDKLINTVDDHGFVWSLSSDPALGNGNLVSFGKVVSDVFDTTLTGFSVNDDNYYAVAYVQYRGNTVYGEILSFNFRSFDVSIREVDPLEDVDNNRITLRGDIRLTNMEDLEFDSIMAYGHVISSTQPNPEVGQGDAIHSDLGSTREDGLFTSTISDLDFNTTYNARAYAMVNGEYVYSADALQFRIRDGWLQLNEEYELFMRNGTAASTASLAYVGVGCGFSCSTDDEIVYQFDPAQPDAPWTEVGAFPGTDLPAGYFREGAVSFVIGEFFYVGMGKKRQDVVVWYTDLWRYHPAEGWTELTALPAAPREDAVAFTIGDKAYVGLGLWKPSSEGRESHDDLWEFDPIGNGGMGSWAEMDVFLGDSTSGRYAAVAAVIGQKGYVGTGGSGAAVRNDFWEFDPAAAPGSQWKQLADVPGKRLDAVAFAANGKVILGSGFNFENKLKDFWAYDPGSNTWSRAATLPGDARFDAVAFSINDIGYFGTGSNEDVGLEAMSDLWMYTPAED